MARGERRRALKEEAQATLRETEALRDASRQLYYGLIEYAKVENWNSIPSADPGGKPMIVWIGPGDGPKLARKHLGLEEEQN